MTDTQRVGLVDAPIVRPEPRRSAAIGHLRRFAVPARHDGAVVGALMGLALLLRLPNLGRAFWVDEGISVGIASHPVTQIPGLLRLDGSPPLWYLLLHFWIRVAGSSVIATHLLPLGISILLVPVVYRCAAVLFGRAAAVAGAGLAATNPFLSWYSTETRMYTLVVLLAAVALTCSVEAVRHRRMVAVAGAIVSFAALVYLHYWSLYLLGVTVVVLLVHAWRCTDVRLAVSVIVAASGVGVLFAPWIPTLLFQAQTTAAPWAVPPGIGDLFADPSSMLAGTLGFVVVPVLVLALWRSHRHRRPGDRLAINLLGAIGLGTLGVGWLISQLEPSWTIRYLAVALAPLLLALAGTLSTTVRGRLVLAAVVCVLALASAVGSLLPNTNARFAKSNVAAVTAAVAARLRPGDLVIAAQTEQLAVLAYYLPHTLRFASPLGVTTDPGVVDWRNIVDRLQQVDVCTTLLPDLQRLPVGAHVFEINPLRAVGASGTAWHNASDRDWLAVDALLAGQGGLALGPSYNEGTEPKPYSAVEGQLFTRTPGPISCP